MVNFYYIYTNIYIMIEGIIDPITIDMFKYKFGEQRPILFNYMLSLPNYYTYLDVEQENKFNKFTDEEVPYFKCYLSEKSGKMAKKLQLPSDETYKNSIIDSIDNAESGNLLLIPINLYSRGKCRNPDNSIHSNILIYNPHYRSFERIDIKKYHIDGFLVKVLYKSLNNTFLKEVNSYLLEEVYSDYEIEYTYDFANKLNEKLNYKIYPIFLLCYIHLRSKNPTYKSESILNQVSKLSLKSIKKIWNHFLNYLKKAEKESNYCKYNVKPKIYNSEINSCLSKKSKTLKKYKIEENVKCQNGLVYDNYTRKCIKQEDKRSINIIDEDIGKYEPKENIDYIQLGNPLTNMLAVTYMSKKYPYAKLIYDRNVFIDEDNILMSNIDYYYRYRDDEDFTESDEYNMIKEGSGIRWYYNEDTEDFKFTYPENMVKTFIDYLSDRELRFIVILLSLREPNGSKHANSIIYDIKTNEFERFDPLGVSLHEHYETDRFDNIMKAFIDKYFKEYIGNYKYYSPLSFCPNYDIFQSQEINEIVRFFDRSGNCALWNLWYINVRMANPDLSREETIIMANNKIKTHKSFYHFIKSYQLYLIDVLGL